MPIFGSILPISLQQIASEKIYTVHSNELAEGYTLMSVTIFLDKYRGGSYSLKLVVFLNFASFLPISLQKINPEKIQKLHSNELVKGYNTTEHFYR